jgi:hypothetical protein
LCPLAVTGGAGNCFSTSSQSNYEFVSSNQTRTAVAVGVSLFWPAHDMFSTDTRPWYSRLAPKEPFFGPSVYPLNQYFAGLSAEPRHGLNFTIGYVLGSQTCLPKGYQFSPGDVVTIPAGSTTAPTVPSATRFRSGAFFMMGFDTTIFNSVFANIINKF